MKNVLGVLASSSDSGLAILKANVTGTPFVPTASAMPQVGAQVAVVQPDATVHLQKIAVGRDYGDRVEILQGLADGSTIVMMPGDSAREGAKIVPVSRDTEQK